MAADLLLDRTRPRSVRAAQFPLPALTARRVLSVVEATDTGAAEPGSWKARLTLPSLDPPTRQP